MRRRARDGSPIRCLDWTLAGATAAAMLAWLYENAVDHADLVKGAVALAIAGASLKPVRKTIETEERGCPLRSSKPWGEWNEDRTNSGPHHKHRQNRFAVRGG
jgi:hypothetical protein